MKLLVTIPLCDYEPISTRNWHRWATHFIVRYCLGSLARYVQTPLDLYILADRCTPGFVQMATRILAPFEPVVLDNSNVSPILTGAALPEKLQHVANQFLKAIDLGEDYDIVYFCEQDYIFKDDAIEHGLVAFEEVPEINLISLFDHPDRHLPHLEPLLGRHTYFRTRLSTWKSISSTNGNLLWRTSFFRDNREWILNQFLEGGMDYELTTGLRRRGETLLAPTKSLIQHFRLDGTNASPTFESPFIYSATGLIFRILLSSKMLRRRLGILQENRV